ncbi:MAG: hypothetical protein ABEJ57_01520 [Halobacteriaceae archaeon]
MRRQGLLGLVVVAVVMTAGCASLVGGDSTAEPRLNKQIVGPNTSVEGVGLDVRVTNIGGSATEGTVFGTAELENGTVRRAVERFQLGPGESTTVTLRWPSIDSLNGVVFKVSVESD